MDDDVESDMEDIAEEQVLPLIDSTGDFAKSIVETFESSGLSLAQADAQSESNNSSAYAGAAFGVIGLAATLALISTFNKKAVQENQEALL